jgi:hypothetical protein
MKYLKARKVAVQNQEDKVGHLLGLTVQIYRTQRLSRSTQVASLKIMLSIAYPQIHQAWV